MVTDQKALLEALRSVRFRYSSEEDLQLGIDRLFRERGIVYEREVRLDSHCRIDFMVEGSIGIEVKIDGSAEELGRQILRYLQHDRVSEIVVVTTRATHRDLPPMLEGKRITVVYLFSSAF